MTKSRLLAAMTALALASVSLGHAHDLNVFASNLAVHKSGERTTVYLGWGHILPVDDLTDSTTLERYDCLSPTGKVTALKHEGVSLQTNVVELKEEGVCQVVAARKPYIYTVLVNDDGESGFKFKIGPKSAVKEGTVDYAMHWQAFAKALIVVGEPKSEAVKPAGLPIEIVPVEGPASWRSGHTLRFRLLHANKPLPYQEVWATRVGLLPHGTWCFAAYADEEGIVSVPVKEAGTWVVRMQRKKLAAAKDRNDYDFDTLNATLTLEVQP
jgi:uncharacterized GH25 family protein